MIYNNIRKAVFLDRPNRFIANVLIDGKQEVCHVKNTGRCRELLIPGAEIYVEETGNPARKTKYDLISVKKGGKLINIDSMAPNKVFKEWLSSSGYFGETTLVRPETVFGNSRFDFYIEASGSRIFAEIKGVTLEDGGIVRFPDAPTERGVKHLNELIRCRDAGYDAYAVFVVQMSDVKWFEPNWATHAEFGRTLRSAKNCGVNLLAFSCDVTPESIIASKNVEIRL